MRAIVILIHRPAHQEGRAQTALALLPFIVVYALSATTIAGTAPLSNRHLTKFPPLRSFSPVVALWNGAVMSHAHVPRIHPTAVISREAEMADGVVIGPYVVIEGAVRLGRGCVLHPRVTLCGPLTMGERNLVFSGAVLGERPQHAHYKDEATRVEIGDDNIFHEHVTVHRGTTQSWVTRIGNQNMFMANSHVAHDCQVGNRCTLATGALVGGHCLIEDDVFLSSKAGVHQYCRVGRLAFLSEVSGATNDVPPFIRQQYINVVTGLNVIGMRRAGMSRDHINAVRSAYQIIYCRGNLLPVALAEVERLMGHLPAIAELVTFIRQSKRGINAARLDRDQAMAPISPPALLVKKSARRSAMPRRRAQRSSSSAVEVGVS
jgi:UDP-N-acetylglucosamine acyltransferase